MNRDRAVLIVAGRPDLVNAARAALAHEPRARLLQAVEPNHALDLARRESPVAIVLDPSSEGRAELELALAVRAEDQRHAPTLVMLVAADAVELGAVARRAGIDHVLERPVSPERLHEVLAVAFERVDLRERLEVKEAEIARLEERHADDRRRIGELEDELERCSEQAKDLLVGVLELGVPGALDRGLRIAELANRLAARFAVPPELVHDLEMAAQLHELGRLVVASETGQPAGVASSDAWRYAQSTVAILKRAEGLSGAADLIGGIYENWDGTGRPGHWQAGQIPLRCRILRVLVDFFAALEDAGPANRDAVMESFETHGGTLYDPLVLVHLKGLLEGRAEDQVLGNKVLMPIMELREGMVLAEDLYTDSGLKLLSRDTELTPATLEIIRRRHRAEPILQGAAVRRSAA